MENEVNLKDEINYANQLNTIKINSNEEVNYNNCNTKINGDHLETEFHDNEEDQSSSDAGHLVIDQDVQPNEDERTATPVSLKRKSTEIIECNSQAEIFSDNNSMKYKKMLMTSFLPEPDLVPPANLFNDTNDLPTTNRNNINPFAFGHPEEVKQFLKQQIKFNKMGKILGKDKRKLDGQINEYAQYLGLQPAVKFKCFKCSESRFSSLSELKEHQTICLSKCDSNLTNSINQSNSLNCNLNELKSENSQYNITSTLLSTTTSSNPTAITSSSSSSSSITTATLGASTTTSKLKISDPSTKIRITRKVFLCSSCGTYYENWNLFLHMREVHKRHICLFCLGLFPSAERLVLHLENKHNIIEKSYNNKDDLLLSYKDPCYLMCCICEHVFTEIDNFHIHMCEYYMEPCNYCGLKSVHKPNCKGNIIGAAVKSSTQSTSTLPSSSIKHHRDKDKKITKTNKMNKNLNLDINGSNLHNKTIIDNLSNGIDTISGTTPVFNDVDNNKDILKCNNNKTDDNRINNLEYRNKKIIDDEQTLNLNNLESESDNLNSNESNINNEIINKNKFSYNLTETMEHQRDIPEEPIPPDESNEINVKESNTRNIVLSENFNNSLESSQNIDEMELENSNNVSENDSLSEDNDAENHSTEMKNFPKIITNNDDNLVNLEKPLLVPKLKVKIPKEFHTPIESEESSTESDDELELSNMQLEEEEEDEEEDDDDEEEEVTDNNHEEQNENNGNEQTEINDKQEEITQDDIKSPKKEIQNDEDGNVNLMNTSVEIQKENNLDALEVATQVANDESIIENKYINEDDLKMDTIENNKQTASDGIIVAGEDTLILELSLDEPLDKLNIKQFIRTCLLSTFPLCLYCNHARRIAVNGKSLALHLIGQHKFSAIVNSITAEELLPTTIVTRLKLSLEDLDNIYFNLDSYDSSDKNILPPIEKTFECFQCRFITKIHKELYLHNRKMHLKTILLCIMCKSNFYSYSELICHICPGIYNKVMILDITFRCCICNLDNIQSAFRLMVHLRKKHFACDVCLEECIDQSRLSNHVWKHKLHHLCYRCGIAYRNKPDITKHLFWKHGTESVLCKKCLQKKWPHVYHFCIPPTVFICEVCTLTFNKAVTLKVHKRLHSGDAPYPCTEDNCEKKFISRKLLLKHVARHTIPPIIEINQIPTIIKNEDELKSVNENNDYNITVNNNIDQMIIEEIKKVKKKKSSKTIKKEKEEEENEGTKNVIDIMDLPVPNLSESDSSDDELNENLTELKTNSDLLFQENVEIVGEDDTKPAPIIDIWDNFKSYQASHSRIIEDENDDDEKNILPPPILHVCQSDHDYSRMYTLFVETPPEAIIKDEVKENNKIKLENKGKGKIGTGIGTSKHKKEQKSPKKSRKSGSDSSSSDSSTESDSCSCGTDCSCTSSSSGSTSSSSTSDSSSSEGKRRIAAKKERKLERKRLKSEPGSKALSDTIDVVATDKPLFNEDPDSIIFESDLETEESETDEDFYDEHPQKLATQLLAEKRQQLMLQTCMNPMNNAIVENSRPSTPSLPEEVVKEKKVKVKKKKKDRKSAKNQTLVPPLKLNIPILPVQMKESNINLQLSSVPIVSPITLRLPTPSEYTTITTQSFSVPIYSTTTTPAPISNLKLRLSTGSGSETDGNVKRSKRRRIPNRFYGYSSDEDSGMMKPTPPPNLTWRKEDLPSPLPVRTPPPIKASIKSPSIGYKTPVTNKTASISDFQRNTPKIYPATISSPISFPPISPVVIRPPPQPPRVEPLRVPAVPVHHITPPVIYNRDSGKSSESSDSDSSSEGSLQISQNLPPIKTKIILPQLPPQNLIGARIHSQSRLFLNNQNIRYPFTPPAGCRPAKEGEKVYCYCQCPYDEVSEMIACDGDNCTIEWFHFECVGIMVPPKGKWYCPDCKPKYFSGNNEYLESDNT